MSRAGSFRSLLAVFFLISMSACAGRAGVKVGEIPPPAIPSAEQKDDARAFVNHFADDEGHTLIKSGPLVQRVDRIISRLTKAAGFPAKTFNVHVVDAGEDSNAMAVNGASIVVFKKLLERVSEDDDLAVVLGHEVGHILGRHSEENHEEKDRAQAVEVGSTILGVIASVAAAAAGAPDVAGDIGDITQSTTGMIGYGAFVGSFSRDQEYEADHIGLMLMAKAGYDPKRAAPFWQRSEEIFGSSYGSLEAFFSTHPAPGDRVNSLVEALPIAEQYYQDYQLRNPIKKASAKAPKTERKATKS